MDIDNIIHKKYTNINELKQEIKRVLNISEDILDKIDLSELFYYIKNEEYDRAKEWFMTYIYPLVQLDIKQKIAHKTIYKLQQEFEEQLRKLFEEGKIKIKDLKDIYEMLKKIAQLKEEFKDIRKAAKEKDLTLIKKYIEGIKKETQNLKQEIFEKLKEKGFYEFSRYFYARFYDIEDRIKRIEANMQKLYERIDDIIQEIETLQKLSEEKQREETKRFVSKSRIKNLAERQRLLLTIKMNPQAKYNIALSALDMILRIIKIQQNAIINYFVSVKNTDKEKVKQIAQNFISEWIKKLEETIQKLKMIEMLNDDERVECIINSIAEIKRFLNLNKKLNLVETSTRKTIENIYHVLQKTI